MKSYDDTIKSIFEKGDAILEQKKKRTAKIRRISYSVSGICAALIISAGILHDKEILNSKIFENIFKGNVIENPGETTEISQTTGTMPTTETQSTFSTDSTEHTRTSKTTRTTKTTSSEKTDTTITYTTTSDETVSVIILTTAENISTEHTENATTIYITTQATATAQTNTTKSTTVSTTRTTRTTEPPPRTTTTALPETTTISKPKTTTTAPPETTTISKPKTTTTAPPETTTISKPKTTTFPPRTTTTVPPETTTISQPKTTTFPPRTTPIPTTVTTNANNSTNTGYITSTTITQNNENTTNARPQTPGSSTVTTIASALPLIMQKGYLYIQNDTVYKCPLNGNLDLSEIKIGMNIKSSNGTVLESVGTLEELQDIFEIDWTTFDSSAEGLYTIYAKFKSGGIYNNTVDLSEDVTLNIRYRVSADYTDENDGQTATTEHSHNFVLECTTRNRYFHIEKGTDFRNMDIMFYKAMKHNLFNYQTSRNISFTTPTTGNFSLYDISEVLDIAYIDWNGFDVNTPGDYTIIVYPFNDESIDRYSDVKCDREPIYLRIMVRE